MGHCPHTPLMMLTMMMMMMMTMMMTMMMMMMAFLEAGLQRGTAARFPRPRSGPPEGNG